MNGERERIVRRRDLLNILLRSLLIQAAWSYERMQSIGFAYALEPALRRIYPDRSEYEERLNLHLEYFNTQPYFASFILGAVARREEDRAAGRAVDPEDIGGIKTALMGPLGALGDSFFWGALKPLAAVAACALLLTGHGWAPILFLVLFNLWHVGLRTGMLYWGYESAGDAVALMEHYRFTTVAKRFKLMTLALIGGMLGVMPFWRGEFRAAVPVSGPLLPMLGLAAALVLVAALRKGASPVNLILGLAILCFALAFAGVV